MLRLEWTRLTIRELRLRNPLSDVVIGHSWGMKSGRHCFWCGNMCRCSHEGSSSDGCMIKPLVAKDITAQTSNIKDNLEKL